MRWHRRGIPLAAAIAAAVLAAAPGGALSAPLPVLDRPVVDDANVLGETQRRRMDRWLRATRERTGVEITVVTIRSIGDYDVRTYWSIDKLAEGLAARYSFGPAPHPKGILLLVSVNDRDARIELGEGLADRRDDALRILDGAIWPELIVGNENDAVLAGTKALMLEFAGVRAGKSFLPLLAFTVAIIAGPVAVSVYRNGKTGWGWVCVGPGVVVARLVRRVLARGRRARRTGTRQVIGGGATGSW